jgi:amino-transferase class IV
MLVVEGRPVESAAHLQRLARSVESVYSQMLPSQATARLHRAAEGLSLGRLRLTAAPAEDGLRIDLLAGGVDAEAVFPDRGVKLRTYPVSGGLGAHKWVHRPGINRAAPDEAGALIVDEGEVLEAGWANVFAVRGGTLFTPTLDGRLLPGTTRAAILELAPELEIESNEQPLSPDDLLSADETFLTGSIRGIEPAEELNGQPLPGCGEISRHLAVALRQRWSLPSEKGAPQAAAAAPKPDQLAR